MPLNFLSQAPVTLSPDPPPYQSIHITHFPGPTTFYNFPSPNLPSLKFDFPHDHKVHSHQIPPVPSKLLLPNITLIKAHNAVLFPSPTSLLFLLEALSPNMASNTQLHP